ncbi:hypothetical protein ABB37_02887 [Leptomonas pyrrhocoris]|uniref:Uncharacterized protein n=1 Tax=Leptomonas pyrrhocoris TaxID=157538 RepID=A0A0M9G658_LEPPY|nr:hypothetical protein ABB37_02887 [Leptomonas pyrrhocoris]KPA83203.1 hypothetical protein ABB37_02887 [Leptomonas pyrrhocoris]|eukprot:XP_015661642.1 hypothetical protein ABB37_02887 [Leptomonas pyrrhocoris]
MFSPKYYGNPFAGDDDDLCYGEIMSDQSDVASNVGHANREWHERRPSLPSMATASRRNATEVPSAENSHSAIRSGGDGAPVTHRGQVDTRDYEGYIAELREELESANAENRRLTAAQTRAETRARSLLFEKENAEWQLQQEKEHSRTLAEKVSALEAELEQMTYRESGVAHRWEAAPGHANRELGTSSREAEHAAPPHRGHVDPYASSLKPQQASNSGEDDYVGSHPVSPPLQKGQQGMRARAQLQQRQAAYWASRGGSFERDGTDAAQTAAPEAGKSTELTPAAPGAGLTRSLRGQRRAEAVQEKLLQQQQAADEKAAEVRELEELLQTHCQKRDELATQLQRLESMRLRTVAEKRKKAAVETNLEEEEKTIGHIRLELRSHSALLR